MSTYLFQTGAFWQETGKKVNYLSQTGKKVNYLSQTGKKVDYLCQTGKKVNYLSAMTGLKICHLS